MADDGMGELEEDVVESGLPGAGGQGGGEQVRDKGTGPRSFTGAFKGIREARATAAAGNGAAGGNGNGQGAGEGEGEQAAETPEERETRLAALDPAEREAVEAEEERRGALTPEEREAEDAALLDTLTVDLGVPMPGRPNLVVTAEDQETADYLRNLAKRAVTRDAMFRMREEAEDIRVEADEMRYVVDLDPGGFVLERITDPADRQHLARYLLTQPGVLDGISDFVQALIEHPEAIPAQARIERAEAIERKEKVSRKVEEARFVDQNERQLLRTTHKVLNTLLPQDVDDARYEAILRDIRQDLRYIREQERVRVIDPRRVPGVVQHRLAMYGMAPASKGPAAKPGEGRPGSKTPSRSALTADQLRRNADLRRRAAGAGPGAGSPAARVAPLPPKKEGQSVADRWKETFAHVRKTVSTLRRAPGR